MRSGLAMPKRGCRCSSNNSREMFMPLSPFLWPGSAIEPAERHRSFRMDSRPSRQLLPLRYRKQFQCFTAIHNAHIPSGDVSPSGHINISNLYDHEREPAHELTLNLVRLNTVFAD